MRIGLDGIILRKPVAGSHRYFEQLLAGFYEYAAENEYIVFADRRMLRADVLPQAKNFIYPPLVALPGIPLALQQQFFPAWHAVGSLDVLHAAAFVPPLWYNRPSVATIFDLAFELFPETTRWTGRFWRKILVKPGIARAKRIITLSESAKKDVCRWAGVPADRIRVVHPFAQSHFQAMPKSDAILAQYGLPARYILHVGTLERRKNIAGLVRAFALARRMANLEQPLVLVGARGWLDDDIFRTIEELELRDHVIWLGFVPDEHLPAVYARADLLVNVSLYEGFGLPVLEAMASGVPVLVANTFALPEVVGPAGILVPPHDIPAIAQAIARIQSDIALRETMRANGIARARQFSPARFVQQTLEVYRDALRD